MSGIKKIPYQGLISFTCTEVYIQVKKVYFFSVPQEMSKDTLKAYFKSFGTVSAWQIRQDPRERFKTCLSGVVLFDNAGDATKALTCPDHCVDGMKFEVEPSYSWQQPGACGSPEDQESQSVTILRLNDDCKFHILHRIELPDKIGVARVLHRFYLAPAGQYESIEWRQNEFAKESLLDLKDFFEKFGDQVQGFRLMPVKCLDEIINVITVHCRNLTSLSSRKIELTKDTLQKMPTTIEKLEFFCCNFKVKDLPQICKHFPQLRELNLFGTKVSDTDCTKMVNENCCPSLEWLEITLYDGSECMILAQLPNLKSLSIHNSYYMGIIDQLVEHKAEQLERLECDSPVLDARHFSQIAKLTGLRTLILSSFISIDDDVLRAFADLKKLEKLSLCCEHSSPSAFYDLFTACPKLSQLTLNGWSKTQYEEVIEWIVTRVRQEKARNEMHRMLPIELLRSWNEHEFKIIQEKKPHTVPVDIIKLGHISILESLYSSTQLWNNSDDVSTLGEEE